MDLISIEGILCITEIFDAAYIGTETRSPKYTDQHLPEYLSYALVDIILEPGIFHKFIWQND